MSVGACRFPDKTVTGTTAVRVVQYTLYISARGLRMIRTYRHNSNLSLRHYSEWLDHTT